jgi:hypothetical protein
MLPKSGSKLHSRSQFQNSNCLLQISVPKPIIDHGSHTIDAIFTVNWRFQTAFSISRSQILLQISGSQFLLSVSKISLSKPCLRVPKWSSWTTGCLQTTFRKTSLYTTECLLSTFANNYGNQTTEYVWLQVSAAVEMILSSSGLSHSVRWLDLAVASLRVLDSLILEDGTNR